MRINEGGSDPNRKRSLKALKVIPTNIAEPTPRYNDSIPDSSQS